MLLQCWCLCRFIGKCISLSMPNSREYVPICMWINSEFRWTFCIQNSSFVTNRDVLPEIWCCERDTLTNEIRYYWYVLAHRTENNKCRNPRHPTCNLLIQGIGHLARLGESHYRFMSRNEVAVVEIVQEILHGLGLSRTSFGRSFKQTRLLCVRTDSGAIWMFNFSLLRILLCMD